MVLVVAFCSHLCTRARSWREFAKSRFTHFPSISSVHVDSYAMGRGVAYDVCISGLLYWGGTGVFCDGHGSTVLCFISILCFVTYNYKYIYTQHTIGLYRENAIAIENEASDSLTYYRCIDQSGFARKECNLHCEVHVAAENRHILPPFGSLDSFWITRSQRSRRRDKGVLSTGRL